MISLTKIEIRLSLLFLLFSLSLCFYNPTFNVKDDSHVSKNKIGSREERLTLDYGLERYNQGDYATALKVFLSLNSQDVEPALLWNNVCASYNQLKMYPQAIMYCQKALGLKPDFELARNNLLWAQRNNH